MAIKTPGLGGFENISFDGSTSENDKSKVEKNPKTYAKLEDKGLTEYKLSNESAPESFGQITNTSYKIESSISTTTGASLTTKNTSFSVENPGVYDYNTKRVAEKNAATIKAQKEAALIKKQEEKDAKDAKKAENKIAKEAAKDYAKNNQKLVESFKTDATQAKKDAKEAARNEKIETERAEKAIDYLEIDKGNKSLQILTNNAALKQEEKRVETAKQEIEDNTLLDAHLESARKETAEKNKALSKSIEFANTEIKSYNEKIQTAKEAASKAQNEANEKAASAKVVEDAVKRRTALEDAYKKTEKNAEKIQSKAEKALSYSDSSDLKERDKARSEALSAYEEKKQTVEKEVKEARDAADKHEELISQAVDAEQKKIREEIEKRDGIDSPFKEEIKNVTDEELKESERKLKEEEKQAKAAIKEANKIKAALEYNDAQNTREKLERTYKWGSTVGTAHYLKNIDPNSEDFWSEFGSLLTWDGVGSALFGGILEKLEDDLVRSIIPTLTFTKSPEEVPDARNWGDWKSTSYGLNGAIISQFSYRRPEGPVWGSDFGVDGVIFSNYKKDGLIEIHETAREKKRFVLPFVKEIKSNYETHVGGKEEGSKKNAETVFTNAPWLNTQALWWSKGIIPATLKSTFTSQDIENARAEIHKLSTSITSPLAQKDLKVKGHGFENNDDTSVGTSFSSGSNDSYSAEDVNKAKKENYLEDGKGVSFRNILSSQIEKGLDDSTAFNRMMSSDPFFNGAQFNLYMTLDKVKTGWPDLGLVSFRVKDFEIPQFARKSSSTYYGSNLLSVTIERIARNEQHATLTIICDKELKVLLKLANLLGSFIKEDVFGETFVKPLNLTLRGEGEDAKKNSIEALYNLSSYATSDVSEGFSLQKGAAAVLEMINGREILKEGNFLEKDSKGAKDIVDYNNVGYSLGPMPVSKVKDNYQNDQYIEPPLFLFSDFKIQSIDFNLNFVAGVDVKLLELKAEVAWTKMQILQRKDAVGSILDPLKEAHVQIYNAYKNEELII